MVHETGTNLTIVSHILSNLTLFSQQSGVPGTVVFLGSKLVRSPNSPHQVVSSAVKKSVMGFAGSLFFEKRMQGIRVSMVNPGPDIPLDALVKSLLFPMFVSKTCCVEALDIVKIHSFPSTPAHEANRGACFVTGGSRGIGKAIAMRIAQEFKLPTALLGRDEQALESTRQECARFLGDPSLVRTFAFDVREDDRLKTAIESTAKQFGGIQVLVCSAGINRRAKVISSDGLKSANPKVWKDLMDINFTSAMSATAYAMPFMVNRPNGPSVFYIGSRTIRLGTAPGQQAYIASKMAIAGFAASIQSEVKTFGVRVVVLNTGLVATDLGNRIPKTQSFQLAPAELQTQPSDVADAVTFTLRLDPCVSPVSFDICGTTEEYRDPKGKPLKMANL